MYKYKSLNITAIIQEKGILLTIVTLMLFIWLVPVLKSSQIIKQGITKKICDYNILLKMSPAMSNSE